MAVLIYILCIVCNREVKSFWKPLNHGCDSVFEDVLRCEAHFCNSPACTPICVSPLSTALSLRSFCLSCAPHFFV